MFGNELTKEEKEIEQFIKEHTHINYCECIILPDGKITYAVPSHVMRLIEYTGLSPTVIYSLMPNDAIPIKWLVEFTKCIAIYTNGYIAPENYTAQQAYSLELLRINELTQQPFRI